MDFTLPDTANDVGGLADDIVARVVTPERVAELEETGAPIDDRLWRASGDAGLVGLELPSAVTGESGADLTMVENVAIATTLGAALARVPFGPHAMVAAPVIARSGTAGLVADLGPSLAVGATIGTFGIDEDPGADLLTPHTALTADGDGWRLSGTKIGVPYARAADLIVVTAASPEGVRAVVVAAGDDDVHVTDLAATGLTPVAAVEFDGVAVSADRILTGAETTVLDLALRAELALCADQTGVVDRALALTAEYAREREQFGRPIGSFQAVAQRLADGYIDAQALSLTTTQAAWLYAQSAGERSSDAPVDVPVGFADLEVAVHTAKFWACEAGHRVAHTAVHVHGGVGLDTSHPIHRYFLRAKQNEFDLAAVPVTLRRIGDALAAAPA
ncbi:acyl-CoA dehydrogenase family protein [Gordonia sinesedis]